MEFSPLLKLLRLPASGVPTSTDLASSLAPLSALFSFHKEVSLQKRLVLLLKEWVLCLWIWAAAVQTLHGCKSTAKGHIKAKVKVIPLYRASTQPCRAMNSKTNETKRSLLKSAGSVVKLTIKTRIVRVRTHLIGCNTTIAKHLYSHRDYSS